MKSIVLVCLFVVGSMANSYGPAVKVSYGSAVRTPEVISYAPAPAPMSPPVQSYSSYSAPPPPAPASPPVVASYSSYSPAPAPMSPPAQSYGSSYSSYGGESIRATPIPIVRYNAEIREGVQSHEYESGNGVKHQEQTNIRMVQGTPTAEDAHHGSAIMSKVGSFSYMSPEGQQISLSYTADENGFHPVGTHLPVAPLQPEEIVNAIRAHEAAHAQAAAEAARAPSSFDAYSPASSYSSYSPPSPPAPPPQRQQPRY